MKSCKTVWPASKPSDGFKMVRVLHWSLTYIHVHTAKSWNLGFKDLSPKCGIRISYSIPRRLLLSLACNTSPWSSTVRTTVRCLF